MTRKILIVDDDRATLLALPDALRTRLSEVRVDVAGSASSALTMMEHIDYDLVICDVVMPEMDGVELLQKARQRWPQLVVVLVTAGDLGCEREALRYGAFAFVAKPLDIDRFVPMLREALRQAAILRDPEAPQAHTAVRAPIARPGACSWACNRSPLHGQRLPRGRSALSLSIGQRQR